MIKNKFCDGSLGTGHLIVGGVPLCETQTHARVDLIGLYADDTLRSCCTHCRAVLAEHDEERTAMVSGSRRRRDLENVSITPI